jgi:hypothetical protein
MPKQMYTLNDFSGGINNLQDPRDIKDSEFVFIKNFSIDQRGALKTAGSVQSSDYFDGQAQLSNYVETKAAVIEGAGGFGLFYFESDHGLLEVTSVSGNTISFVSAGGGGATP